MKQFLEFQIDCQFEHLKQKVKKIFCSDGLVLVLKRLPDFLCRKNLQVSTVLTWSDLVRSLKNSKINT